MSTVNSGFDYAAENERNRLMAEEDRRGFLKVVIAAGIAMFVMFLLVLAVLVMVGQKGMPLDHGHREANALLVWPVVKAGQGVGWYAAD